jgi:hypothetical protein
MFLIAVPIALIGPRGFFVPDDDPKPPLALLSVAGCGGGPLLCPLDRGFGRCRECRFREIEDPDEDDRDEHDSEDPSASNDGFFFLSSFGTNLVYFRGGLGTGGIVARYCDFSKLAKEGNKSTDVYSCDIINHLDK